MIEETTVTYSSAFYKKLYVDATLLSYLLQNVALLERTGSSFADSGTMIPSDGSNTSWSANDTVVNLIIEQTTAGAGVFGLNDFANETTGGAQGIDSFSDANASSFQAVSSASDPFAPIFP